MFLEKVILGLSSLAKVFDFSTQEAEAGGLRIQDLPGVCKTYQHTVLTNWRSKRIQALYITVTGNLSVKYLGVFRLIF